MSEVRTFYSIFRPSLSYSLHFQNLLSFQVFSQSTTCTIFCVIICVKILNPGCSFSLLADGAMTCDGYFVFIKGKFVISQYFLHKQDLNILISQKISGFFFPFSFSGVYFSPSENHFINQYKCWQKIHASSITD